MYKIVIQDLDVWFNSEDLKKIKDIKNIILNNYSLICSFIGTKKVISINCEVEDAFYIKDFYQYFEEVLKKYFPENNETSNNISLENIYLLYLIKTTSSNFLTIDNNITNEYYTFIINYLVPYYFYQENGNFEQFVNFCKTRGEETRNEINVWLRKKGLYGAYNNVLSLLIKKIQEDDCFFRNIRKIREIMINAIQNDYSSEKEINIETITKEDIIMLFPKFLKYINAPKEWFRKYFELTLRDDIKFGYKNVKLQDALLIRIKG